jgi:hypothetical protein
MLCITESGAIARDSTGGVGWWGRRGCGVEDGVGVGVARGVGVMVVGGVGKGRRQCAVAQLILGPVGISLWRRGPVGERHEYGDHCVRRVMHHPLLMGYLMGLYLRLQGLDKGVQGGHGIACLVVARPGDVASLACALSHMVVWLRLCSSRNPSELQRTGEQTRSPLL